MYYIYLIQNSVSKNKYIGYTNDLKRRLLEHNQNKNRATKAKIGTWELKYYEAYLSQEDALMREKRLKQHGRTKQELYKRCSISINVKSGAGLTFQV
ncbi:GIY-YIG nuclease family protein [Spirochaetota bacterium]